MLSDGQRRRLEQEKKSFEQSYELQSEKIAKLRNALVVETDPSRKFQYEQQIQAEENELKKLTDRLDEIEKQLQPQRVDKPFQAPPLPTYYVDRPEYIQGLKTRLLTNSSDVRTVVVTAIHGLGSVGKSTLAMAVAHDKEVQAHFCDGILWATLGQRPNILFLLSVWVQALGDYNFKATSVEATYYQLRTLLYDKAVLLVVDDAWNAQDIKAFNVGGARCQLLVTTREGVIADVLRAKKYPLDVMTPEQSMELLTKKLDRDITGAERHQAEILAKELGYLPLALELAAAQVDSGVSWKVLLEDIQREVARLKTLDRPGVRDISDEAILKSLSLTASLNLSIKRLKKYDQECFAWLGVLPEDATITPSIAATLWKMEDERNAAEELCYLQSKALLLSGVLLASETPTYRLHDLFHDLARNLLTASSKPCWDDFPGLGMTFTKAQTIFLEKYREKIQHGLWHTLPNDGYIHQHLVWHLEKADCINEIHKLLREETQEGYNAWYEVRQNIGQITGYLSDVSRALKLVDFDIVGNRIPLLKTIDTVGNQIQLFKNTLPRIIGLQCLYALIISSFNTIAGKTPVVLLVGLVKNKVWSPESCLAYAKRIFDPNQKVAAIVELVSYLPELLVDEALLEAIDAVKMIENERERAQGLISLVRYLPSKFLQDSITIVQKIHQEQCRTAVLNVLIPYLPENLLSNVFEIIQDISNKESHAKLLSILAVKLPPHLLPDVLAAARQIQDEKYRADALSSLAVNTSKLLPVLWLLLGRFRMRSIVPMP